MEPDTKSELYPLYKGKRINPETLSNTSLQHLHLIVHSFKEQWCTRASIRGSQDSEAILCSTTTSFTSPVTYNVWLSHARLTLSYL